MIETQVHFVKVGINSCVVLIDIENKVQHQVLGVVKEIDTCLRPIIILLKKDIIENISKLNGKVPSRKKERLYCDAIINTYIIPELNKEIQ